MITLSTYTLKAGMKVKHLPSGGTYTIDKWYMSREVAMVLTVDGPFFVVEDVYEHIWEIVS